MTVLGVKRTPFNWREGEGRHEADRPAPSVRPFLSGHDRHDGQGDRDGGRYRPSWDRHEGGHHTSITLGFGFVSAPPVYSVCPAPAVVSVPTYVVPEPAYIPAPTVASSATYVVPEPVYQAPVAEPSVSWSNAAAPAPGTIVARGTLSRDDDVAPKEALIVDGIVIKIEDTDKHPLDADLEIRVGDFEKDYDDLPIGTRIEIVGRSGQLYHLDLVDIDDSSETVAFVMSR